MTFEDFKTEFYPPPHVKEIFDVMHVLTGIGRESFNIHIEDYIKNQYWLYMTYNYQACMPQSNTKH